MTENDLSRKLESLKTPKIELQNHRQKLRHFLLSQYKQKRSNVAWLWKAVPMMAGLAILAVAIFNSQLFPKLDVALAKEIAFKDSRVKVLLDQGAIMKEAEVAENKGFLLFYKVNQPEKVIAAKETNSLASANMEKLFGALDTLDSQVSVFLVEVNFKNKKVSSVKRANLPSSFTEAEKLVAQSLVGQSELVKEMIPSEAKIKEIKPVLPQIKLIKQNKEVKAVPFNEAKVIYQTGDKSWQATVNFEENKVESVEPLNGQ
jgi:hypothetical protein